MKRIDPGVFSAVAATAVMALCGCNVDAEPANDAESSDQGAADPDARADAAAPPVDSATGACARASVPGRPREPFCHIGPQDPWWSRAGAALPYSGAAKIAAFDGGVRLEFADGPHVNCDFDPRDLPFSVGAAGWFDLAYRSQSDDCGGCTYVDLAAGVAQGGSVRFLVSTGAPDALIPAVAAIGLNVRSGEDCPPQVGTIYGCPGDRAWDTQAVFSHSSGDEISLYTGDEGALALPGGRARIFLRESRAYQQCGRGEPERYLSFWVSIGAPSQ